MPVSEFGRIGRDVELRYTQSGDPVCSIAIAVDYGRKGQDGKRPTQWYEVALFGKQAEGLAPYLLKGKQVFFTATDLHVETFQKRDGGQGVKLSGRGQEIKFASDGAQADAGPRQQREQDQAARLPAPRTQQQQPQVAMPDDYSDDIPFDNPYRGTRCLIQ